MVGVGTKVSWAWRCGGEALLYPHATVPTKRFLCAARLFSGTVAEPQPVFATVTVQLRDAAQLMA